MLRRPYAVRALAVAVLAPASMLSGCMVGERPSIDRTVTAAGTMTGDPAIDAVLERLDRVGSAVYTADYDALLNYGGVRSQVRATQSSPTRRAVSIGEVRFVWGDATTHTCYGTSGVCTDSIDAAAVSNTGVTPNFFVTDVARRLRRDAGVRIGDTVASSPSIAGALATCVDVPVTGGTKVYCALDDGVLAKYSGGDVLVDLTAYDATPDESLYQR